MRRGSKRCRSNRTIRKHCRRVKRAEPRSERLLRGRRHTGLYDWAFGHVALLVVLIALVVASTRRVKLSWVVGNGHASLVWITFTAAVLGWLLGILTSVAFRLRTRRRRPA